MVKNIITKSAEKGQNILIFKRERVPFWGEHFNWARVREFGVGIEILHNHSIRHNYLIMLKRVQYTTRTTLGVLELPTNTF